ncbi:hypothetical protein FOZ62_011724, partial [Perkinsus olseni]
RTLQSQGALVVPAGGFKVLYAASGCDVASVINDVCMKLPAFKGVKGAIITTLDSNSIQERGLNAFLTEVARGMAIPMLALPAASSIDSVAQYVSACAKHQALDEYSPPQLSLVANARLLRLSRSSPRKISQTSDLSQTFRFHVYEEYCGCKRQTDEGVPSVNKNRVYRALQRVYRLLPKNANFGTPAWTQRESEWLAVLRWWGCTSHRETGESSAFNTDGSTKENGIDWIDRSSRLQAEALRCYTAMVRHASTGHVSQAWLLDTLDCPGLVTQCKGW